MSPDHRYGSVDDPLSTAIIRSRRRIRVHNIGGRTAAVVIARRTRRFRRREHVVGTRGITPGLRHRCWCIFCVKRLISICYIDQTFVSKVVKLRGRLHFEDLSWPSVRVVQRKLPLRKTPYTDNKRTVYAKIMNTHSTTKFAIKVRIINITLSYL